MSFINGNLLLSLAHCVQFWLSMKLLTAVLVSCAAAVSLAQYSSSDSLTHAYLAGISYCDASLISGWNCGSACSKVSVSNAVVQYDSSLNVQSYTGMLSNGEAVLSFRGTLPKSLKDWIDNLSTTKVPFPGCSGCNVHKGFYDSYLSLKPAILDALDGLGVSPGGTPLHITGHSLGAAMAALAMMDLGGDLGYVLAQTYTYGQPRVGDPTFAASFTNTVGMAAEYRLTHWQDPVPHLPLELMGFHHTPTEVWYNEPQTSYTVCDGSGEDPSCSDSQDFDFNVADHLDYMNIPISDLCPSSSSLTSEPAAETAVAAGAFPSRASSDGDSSLAVGFVIGGVALVAVAAVGLLVARRKRREGAALALPLLVEV